MTAALGVGDAIFHELREATIDMVDRSGPYGDEPGFAWLSRRFGYYTTITDRAEGRYAPVYDNELDLRAIRLASWLMDAEVPVAKAMKARLTDYTIASGFDWTVEHPSPKVRAVCERMLVALLDNSDWTMLERESFEREIVDGEFLGELRTYHGELALHVVESDSLTEPIMSASEIARWQKLPDDLCWTFGVATPNRHPSRALGYHLVYDEGGYEFDYVSAERFIHWKRNVSVQAKRGVADHYTSHKYLKYGDKVLSNTALGTAIQAAIAYIVEHAQGTTGIQAANMAAGRRNVVVKQDRVSGESYRQRRVTPGHVVDVPQGQKYHAGLLGANASTIYIDVMEALFRLAGTVYAFPEHMLTGFAGNNNMASSLVAKTPFVQGRMADQRVRAERLRQMFVKAIALYCKMRPNVLGDFDDIRSGLEVVVNPPEIVDTDISEMTDTLVKQSEKGWVSDRQAVQKLGGDYEDLQAQLKAEAKAKGAAGGEGEGGEGASGDGANEQPQPGVMGGLSRRQFVNNKKAIMDVVREFRAGDLTQGQAQVILAAIGLNKDQVDGLIGSVARSVRESVDRDVVHELLKRYAAGELSERQVGAKASAAGATEAERRRLLRALRMSDRGDVLPTKEHLSGEHDQDSHGHRYGGGSDKLDAVKNGGRVRIPGGKGGKRVIDAKSVVVDGDKAIITDAKGKKRTVALDSVQVASRGKKGKPAEGDSKPEQDGGGNPEAKAAGSGGEAGSGSGSASGKGAGSQRGVWGAGADDIARNQAIQSHASAAGRLAEFQENNPDWDPDDGMQTPEAAALGFVSHMFVEINTDPDSGPAKLMTQFFNDLPESRPKVLYRALGFGSAEEEEAFIDSLNGPQERTFSSWTADSDPSSKEATPMNNIALDLAASFGDRTVVLKYEEPQGAKNVSLMYHSPEKLRKSAGGIVDTMKSLKDTTEFLLPRGHRTRVVSREQVNGRTVVTLASEVSEGFDVLAVDDLDRLLEVMTVAELAKAIGGSNWDPAKHPRGKDGKFIDAGVGAGDWNMNNGSAKWAAKKISMLEYAVSTGDWELFNSIYNPSKPPKNTFSKKVLEAKANLLKLKAEHLSTPPVGQKKSEVAKGGITTQGWTKIGGKLGSQNGGTYETPNGEKFYVKMPTDPARARNEVLAFKLYEAAGVSVPEVALVEIDGNLGVASKWLTDAEQVKWTKGDKVLAAEDFAAHAWLANWDAVGLDFENLQLSDGKLTLMDAGGSLEYRAMESSGKKTEAQWTDNVQEWTTMRSFGMNANTAEVFHAMTPAQLVASGDRIVAMDDQTIAKLVDTYGPTTPGDKGKLALRLIARRDDIKQKVASLKADMGLEGNETPVASSPTSLDSPAVAKSINVPKEPAVVATPEVEPVSVPYAIPDVPKGGTPSCKGYFDKMEKIHAMALAGDADGIFAVKTNAASKNTYAKKLHSYKMEVVAALGSQFSEAPLDDDDVSYVSASPAPAPAPVVAPVAVGLMGNELPAKPDFMSSNKLQVAQNETEVESIEELAGMGDLDSLKALPPSPSPKVEKWKSQVVAALNNKQFPPAPPVALDVPYLKAVEKAAKPATLKKMGYWTVVGSIGGVAEGVPYGQWASYKHQQKQFAEGESRYKKLPKMERNAIEHYTGGGYGPINGALRKGEPTAQALAAVKAVQKAKIPLTVGQKLVRYHFGKLDALKVGEIVAEKGLLSTSSDKNFAWSGDNRWILTVGEGVEGLPVDNFSTNEGESEVVLPPNTRLLVTKLAGQVNSRNEIHGVILPNN